MASVLIVDGQKNVRDYLGGILESAGHRVDLVASTRKAIARLDAVTFDVVVLSSKIGGSKGIDMLPSIRRRSPKTQVVLTGRTASANTAIDALRYGAFDYLVKPIDPDRFEQVVAGAAGMGAICGEKRSLEEGNFKYQQHLEQRIDALNDELKRMREIVKFAEVGCDYILEVDAQGRIIKSNRKSISLFGFDAIGSDVSLLENSVNLDRIALEKLINDIDTVRRENRPVRKYLQFSAIDGTPIETEFQISSRFNDDGTKVTVMVGCDKQPEPDKARRLNEENKCLIRINQINEQMISQLSYEIRTHLVPIKGYVELLVKGKSDWSTTQGMLERTLISVKRLENVANIMQQPRARDIKAGDAV